MTSGTTSLVFENNTDKCKQIYGVACTSSKTVLFTDVQSSKVKEYLPDRNEVCEVIGTGETKSLDGHKSVACMEHLDSTSKEKEFVSEAVDTLERNTQTSFNVQLVCQGPQGTPSNKTVQSVKQLQQLFEKLHQLAATYNPQLLHSINLKALLTLNNGYFNGVIRDFVPTLT